MARTSWAFIAFTRYVTGLSEETYFPKIVDNLIYGEDARDAELMFRYVLVAFIIQEFVYSGPWLK